MKKNLIITAVVICFVFASTLFVSAMTSTILKVNIPFAFQVGKKSLPAGEYLVEIHRATSASALGTALIVRTWDGKTHELVSARPSHEPSGRASLTFNKYSNTYFLASVDSFGLGCELNKTKAEKEIATRLRHSEPVSVAAE